MILSPNVWMAAMTPGVIVVSVRSSKYPARARRAQRQRSPRSRRLYLKKTRSILGMVKTIGRK